MSRNQWGVQRTGLEMASAIKAVAKASGAVITSGEITFITSSERATALAKAFGYRQTAARMANGAEAEAYEQLAARTLRDAGLTS